MANIRQRGELALTLSLLGIFMSLIGIGIGTHVNRTVQTSTSQAQEACSLASFTHVYKEESAIFFAPDEIGQMTITNNRGGSLILKENNRTQHHYSTETFRFDPTRQSNYAQNDLSSITLKGFDSENWKVKELFCTNRGAQGCPDQGFIDARNSEIAKGLNDGTRFENITLQCDLDITYGWILTKRSPDDVTPEPTVTPIQSCPYASTSSVYKDAKGTSLLLSDVGGVPLKVINDRSDTLILNQNGRSANSFSIDPLPFDPTGTTAYPRGARARVTLGGLDDTAWKIESVFCDLLGGASGGCPPQSELDKLNQDIKSGTSDGKNIAGFAVDCGVNTSYGWIVSKRQASCPLLADACMPRKLKIKEVTESGVELSWESPENCSGYAPGKDPFWIDIIRKDDPDTIVCAKEAFDDGTTCKLGKPAPAGRMLDTQSSEYKDKEWDEDQKYEARVHTRSNSASCVSSPAVKSFRYEPEKPPEEPAPNPEPEPTDNPNPDPLDGCHELENGGNGAYTVVIVPSKFSTFGEFLPYAQQIVDDFRSKNLGPLLNAYHFVAYEPLESGTGCIIRDLGNGKGKLACNNPTQAKTQCKAKAGVVIHNINLKGFSGGYTDEHYAVMAKNHLHASAHELGHAIAELNDEYVYSGNVSEGPNCSSNSSCSKWNGLNPRPTCVAVCARNNWYRPEINSVMSHPNGRDPNFNTPSIESFRREGQTFALNAVDDTFLYHTSLHMNVTQEDDGQLSMNAFEIIPSYPDEASDVTVAYYQFSAFDSEGNLVYNRLYPRTRVNVHFPEDVETIDVFDVYLPLSNSIASVSISDEKGTILLTRTIDAKDKKSQEVSPNLCGNNTCDRAIGENSNSCAVDCALREEEKALYSDLNNDKVVNGVDLAIIISEYETPDADIDGDGTTNSIDYSILLESFY